MHICHAWVTGHASPAVPTAASKPPPAAAAWARTDTTALSYICPGDRAIAIPYNGYLKLFAMSGAAVVHQHDHMPYDVILVDDAQVGLDQGIPWFRCMSGVGRDAQQQVAGFGRVGAL